MASLSAETQAIIDRLKQEGDLVRNSGTNSIKAVNIKLEKFEGLFQAISTNVAEQTKILQLQNNIAAEALEKANTQEQLDEIKTKPTTTPVDTTGERIDAIGDKITESINSAFSLRGVLGGFKNIALAGAGLFVGYNLLKGFLDEITGGKFSEMETKLLDFVRNFQTPTIPSFQEVQNSITQMRTDFNTKMTEINTNLSSMATSLQSIAEVFEKIKNITWWDLAQGLVLAFSGVTTALAGLKWWFKRQTVLLDGETRTPGQRQSWWRRLLGIPDPDAPRPPTTPTTPATPAQPYDDEIMRRQRNPRPTTTNPTPAPTTSTAGAGRGTYGMNTPAERAELRSAAAASRSSAASGLRLNSAGRLVNSTGQFVGDEEALRIMQRTLDSRYSKVFANLTKILKAFAGAAAIYALFQVYLILSDETLDRDGKIQALAPILGGALGATGGAAIGAFIATASGVGAGWGTLILGVAGAVVGGIAGDQLGYYVAKWAFDEEPTAAERAAMRAEAEAGWAATNEFAGLEMDTSAPSSPSSVGPQVTAQPATTPRKPTMVPIGQYSSSRLPGQFGLIEAGQELNALDVITERNRMLSQAASGAGIGVAPVIINAPTSVAPTINNIEGGKSVNSLSVSHGGGGGMGIQTNPYGMPGLVN